jgi:hypothetical protein
VEIDAGATDTNAFPLDAPSLDAGVDAISPDTMDAMPAMDAMDAGSPDVPPIGMDTGALDSALPLDAGPTDTGIDTPAVDAGLPLCTFDDPRSTFDNCRLQ